MGRGPPDSARAERGRRRAPPPGRQRCRQRREAARPHTAPGPASGRQDRARSARSPLPAATPCLAGGGGERAPGWSGADPALPGRALRAAPPGMLLPCTSVGRTAAARRRTPKPAPRGLRGKKRRTPPGRPGTEGHLQRLQMRARLGGLNPARGAKLAPAPRPGLLCRCQKVNPPGSPGTLRLAAGPRLTGRAEAEGAGRLPPIHPGHSLYGGRPAPPARCTGRPAPARPIPAARPPPPAPSSTARPGPAPLPAPRPHRPIAPPTFTSRRSPGPALAGRAGCPPPPRRPAPPRLGRAGAWAAPGQPEQRGGGRGHPGRRAPCPASPAGTYGVSVCACVRALDIRLLPRPLPSPACVVCCLAIRYLGACGRQPLHSVPVRRPCSGFAVRATSQAEFSEGTQVRSRLLDALPCTTGFLLQRMLMADELPHAPLRLSAIRRSASLAIPCCFSQDTGAAGCAGNCAARQWLSGNPHATSRSGSSLGATEVHGTITVRWCRVGSLPEMSLSARPRCCKPWMGLHTHITPRKQVLLSQCSQREVRRSHAQPVRPALRWLSPGVRSIPARLSWSWMCYSTA